MAEEFPDLTVALKKAVDEAGRDLGKVNVLIAGRSGVGKSTLVNSVFRGRLATTGQGEPVTKTTRLISKQGVPLAIWDTRGLEMADFDATLGELTRLVEERAGEPDARNRVHVAWLCVHEDGRRVEEAERKLCRALKEHVPVLGVITKARRDDGFRAEVQRLLPEAGNVVRVRAIAEEFDEPGHAPLPPMGLEDLVEATAKMVPDAVVAAFEAAQKVRLQGKTRRAHAVVATAAAAAAAAAAVPIPFAGVAVLAPIQIKMLAGISVLFGLDTSTAVLNTLLWAVAGTTGNTVAVRVFAANLAKFIPGGGTIVGGVVSATAAAACTTTLGEVYVASLVAVSGRTRGETPENRCRADGVHETGEEGDGTFLAREDEVRRPRAARPPVNTAGRFPARCARASGRLDALDALDAAPIRRRS